MTRRSAIGLVLFAVLASVAGLIAYSRFGPKPPPTTVRFQNRSDRLIVIAVTTPGGVQRLTLPGGARGQTRSAPGARLDVWIGEEARGESAAWILDEVGGDVELSLEGAALQLSGVGMKARPLNAD